jgi:hypothetical protein
MHAYFTNHAVCAYPVYGMASPSICLMCPLFIVRTSLPARYYSNAMRHARMPHNSVHLHTCSGTGREDRTGFLFDACKNSCGGCTNQQSCTNGGLFGNRGCCWSTSTLTCLAPGLLLGSDVLNCGACNRVCSTNNIPLPLCSAGQCTGVCRPGFGDCDNNKWLNGCEVGRGGLEL